MEQVLRKLFLVFTQRADPAIEPVVIDLLNFFVKPGSLPSVATVRWRGPLAMRRDSTSVQS